MMSQPAVNSVIKAKVCTKYHNVYVDQQKNIDQIPGMSLPDSPALVSKIVDKHLDRTDINQVGL